MTKLSASDHALPTGWDCRRIRDIATLRSGGTPSRRQNERYFGGGIPWVKTMDLTGKEILRTGETLTVEGLRESSCQLIPRGTVVVAMYGGFRQIGRTGLLTHDAAINQALTAILHDQTQIDSCFLLHWLNYKVRLWRRFAASSRKDPNITKEDVAAFPITLPNLREQRGIRDILDNADHNISRTEELISLLTERKRSLMQQLLSGKKRLPGFSAEWQEVRLDEVATNSSLRNKGTVPDDRLYAVTKAEGLIPMREHVKGATTDRCRVVKHDWFAYNPMRLNIGSLARLHEKEPAMVSPDYVVFYCQEDRLDPDFLDHLRRTRRWQHFVNVAGNGSVRVRIYFKDLGSFKFLLPPIEEQRHIAEILNTCDREIALHRRQLGAIREQKRGLLQKLLTGEVRVKVE